MSLPPIGTVWRTAFEITPIVLVNGLASFMPGGGMLPIAALTETINMPAGLLAGADVSDLDGFFAHFLPMPGGTLIEQDLARYPFANNSVAANAVIAQPLSISLQMSCPAQGKLSLLVKLGIMEALQFALTQHNAQGGMYHVATPSFIYLNCIMKSMRDVTAVGSSQPQQVWQIDFEKPLVTLGDAQQAQNDLFQKITNGSKVLDPAWSGLSTTVGQAGGAGVGTLVPTAGGNVIASTVPSTSGPIAP